MTKKIKILLAVWVVVAALMVVVAWFYARAWDTICTKLGIPEWSTFFAVHGLLILWACRPVKITFTKE